MLLIRQPASASFKCRRCGCHEGRDNWTVGVQPEKEIAVVEVKKTRVGCRDKNAVEEPDPRQLGLPQPILILVYYTEEGKKQCRQCEMKGWKD